MSKLGIVGQGFVGKAVYEIMKNHFEMCTYDKIDLPTVTEKSLESLVKNVDITFVCVPTPMKTNGSCDLSILEMVLRDINYLSEELNKHMTVIIKSTIPPGSSDMLDAKFSNVHIVFNPEFLTEANATEDYRNQNRIVIGGKRPYSTIAKRVFERAFPGVPIIKTSSTIAEMVKYVTNTFLTTKVSFANEMYQICGELGIDYDKVTEYARYDKRLGDSHWSVPGPDGDFGFGGHCFKKDLEALLSLSRELGVDTTMLDAANEKNNKVRTNLDWEKMKGRAVSDN
jgi:UDPglucose 6-dehydrogenase